MPATSYAIVFFS
jgi:hypothetical protein